MVRVDHDPGGGDDFRSILVASIGTPAVTEDLFNALPSNKWSNGLGVTAGAVFLSGIKSGYDGFEFSVPNWSDLENPSVLQANTVD